MIVHGFCDALPGGVVLGRGAQPQQGAEVLHAHVPLPACIGIKAIDHQSFPITRYLRFGRGHDARGHLHA